MPQCLLKPVLFPNHNLEKSNKTPAQQSLLSIASFIFFSLQDQWRSSCQPNTFSWGTSDIGYSLLTMDPLMYSRLEWKPFSVDVWASRNVRFETNLSLLMWIPDFCEVESKIVAQLVFYSWFVNDKHRRFYRVATGGSCHLHQVSCHPCWQWLYQYLI